jgi:DNA primase small subunit
MDQHNEMDLDIEDLANYVDPPQVNIHTTNPVSKSNLERYYRELFPFKLFFKWLGLNNSLIFDKREFTFTLENDIYCRFLSFKDEEEFKQEAIKALPVKIDIGAIYNTQPKLHKSVAIGEKAFFPEKKEMIFDIDMTDYDSIRTCCKDAKMCNKCWKFMILAYKILNSVLTEDFGFENIMWIFSGRRGIHCWVSDERVKSLNNDGRAAVSTYIEYKIVNTQTGVKRILKEPLHPSLE